MEPPIFDARDGLSAEMLDDLRAATDLYFGRKGARVGTIGSSARFLNLMQAFRHDQHHDPR